MCRSPVAGSVLEKWSLSWDEFLGEDIRREKALALLALGRRGSGIKGFTIILITPHGLRM